MDLKSIIKRNLLNEAEGKGSDAGCLMLDFEKKIKNWDDILKIIEPSDLYDDETKTFGFEKEPHVTVLYGFRPEVTAANIQDLFENINQYVKIKLTGIGIFAADGKKPYDVVKFDVDSDDLQTLHKLCKESLPNNESYPDYKPHMTIAYVKAGTGERYVKEFTNPIYMEGNTFTYSTAEHHKTEWKIKKKYRYEININEHIRLTELFENFINEKSEVQNNKNTLLVKQAIANNNYEQPNPQSFKNSLSKSKHSSMLTDYSIEDLSKMKLFKLQGYNIGFALKQFDDNGNVGYTEIVAVHNNEPDIKGIGEDLIKSAVAHGGKHLDHFDGFLTNLYSNLGFQEYKRDAYNPQYDPDGSFANTYGKQDVIYRKFADSK